VGKTRELLIPPDAWREYGFEAGQAACFGPGSSRSGGFCLTTASLVAKFCERTGVSEYNSLGWTVFGSDDRVRIPDEIDLSPRKPGCHCWYLLAVRGSRTGLGFVARGPIYETALQHDELAVFE
jgi:hypothetical protein